MGMFSSALRRDVAGGAFEDFKEGLLDALAGDIAGDANIIGFASDFINLIDVNNPDFGAFYIVVRIL